MYNEQLCLSGAGDVIMELNAYAKALSAVHGAENVFNYSIGNPDLRPPRSVYDAIRAVLEEEDQTAVHGYGPALGLPEVREAVAAHIRGRFGAPLTAENIYMVAGSCAGLAIAVRALVKPGDEVILIAPYFTEYPVFIEAAGAKTVSVPADPSTFYPDVDAIGRAITPRTKAVILNTPNNPSGAVYPEEILRKLTDLLKRRAVVNGRPIYLISDEPYREIVFTGREQPYLMDLYDDTIVSYSFSKSLSLAGDRIGYLAFGDKLSFRKEIMAAAVNAGRLLGHTCAPTLFQKILPRCIGDTADLGRYRENRDLLAGHLESCGFDIVPPEGTFFLLMKSPVPDAGVFARLAAERQRLIMVPTDAFGLPGYVRLAFCVSPDMIRRSLPAFTDLAREYGLTD